MTNKREIDKLLAKKEVLTQQEEQRLFTYYKEHKTGELRNQIMVKNQSLVKKAARAYQNLGVDWEDLCQEGIFGLVQAIDHFEPAKGYRFSTYAYYWINNSISRYITNTKRAIRIPVYIANSCGRIDCLRKEYEQTHGEEASISYLAKAMNMPEAEINKFIQLSDTKNIASLNELVKNEDPESAQLMDFIADTSLSIETQITIQIDREIFHNALKTVLPERDYLILSMRFGLNGNEPQTLESIAKHLHLTKERIRQIESRILKKLRNPAYKYIFDNFEI